MIFPTNFMNLEITSTYGLDKYVKIIPNIKEIKIYTTIPHCLIVYTTYKNPNHTSSITLYNEDKIKIIPGLDDKIYPK